MSVPSSIKSSINYAYGLPQTIQTLSLPNQDPSSNRSFQTEMSLALSNYNTATTNLSQSNDITNGCHYSNPRSNNANIPTINPHLLSTDAISHESKEMQPAHDFSIFLDGYFGQRRPYRVGPSISLDALSVSNPNIICVEGKDGSDLVRMAWEEETLSSSTLTPASSLSPAQDPPSPSSFSIQSNDEQADFFHAAATVHLNEPFGSFSTHLVSSSNSAPLVETMHIRQLIPDSTKDSVVPVAQANEEAKPSLSVSASVEKDTRTFDVLQIWQMNDPCAAFRHEIAMNTMARQGYYPKRPPTGTLVVKHGNSHGKRSHGRRSNNNNNNNNSNNTSTATVSNTSPPQSMNASRRTSHSTTTDKPLLSPVRSTRFRASRTSAADTKDGLNK
ncbi:hypothetical protein BDF19DRAFT_493996 [Syncephalis fuscata]|nr:hypothetical protein BDF19DRAFT_493996 [Syncephalis fuscata]